MGRTKVNLKKLHAALLIQACYRRRLVQKELHRRKKMLNKRRNVSKEILSTEREYVTNLNVLVESFFKPLQQPHNMKHLDDVLSKEFSSSLSGIEVILQFHLSLLADLEKVIQSWSTNTKLGELFEPMALYLKFYSQYVTHYQTVVQLLAKRKTDKNLQHLLESLKPESCGKGIKDYMIMPIQRIPRYQMLLSELIKSTWEDHSDYINLEAAHKKVKTVAETLENQSADALSITKVMELASSFQFDKNNFKIVVPHRRYIAEDDALFVTDGSPIAVRIFLFNDLVILGKSKKDRFKIVGKAKLVPETTTCTFDTPASIGSKLVTATESNILFTIHSQFENDLKFVVSPKSEKKWENDISSLLHGERIWLPHEEKQKKKHAAIVQSPAFQISGTATLSKKRSRISGISTFLSSLKEDMKEKDKNKSKEMKTLALEQLSQSTPERARTPTEIVSARVDDKINVVHRSSSFEPSKLDQHLNPQPISPRKRKHGGLGDSITDDESITTLRSSLYYDVYEEQSVPLDDDEEDEDEISVSRQKTKRKRKVKSIRVSDVDESTNAVRENTKRKRKKHRTTDLTGKLGSQDQLKKKSNRAIVFESGSESIDDDKPLKKDIKKPVTSADDSDITATKRANFRKSLAASRSEHSKQSPYTPEGYRSKKQKSQQS